MKKIFLSAILAGAVIAFGGTVFLSVENTVVGSLFFTIGLFVVCTRGLHLFTGKVCYVFDNDAAYAKTLPVIWLGNLVGTSFIALAEKCTRLVSLSARAQGICELKLSEPLFGAFILAVFCNVMIYIGVEGYRSNPHELGKYLALFFGVCVFILCGFEHCVANMYYISAGLMAKAVHAYAQLAAESGLDLSALTVSNFVVKNLIPVTIGNILGGVILSLLMWFCYLRKKK